MKKFLLSLFASAAALTMSAQTNLLENAGFEEWADKYPVAWKSTTTASNTSGASLTQSTDAHSGSYSACIKNLASAQRLSYKELNLKAGTYTFTFWAKAEDGVNASTRGGYAPWDTAKDALGTYVWNKDYTNNITDWQQITFTFTLKAQTQVNLVVINPKSDANKNIKYSNLLIDDASLTTTDGGIAEGSTPDVTPDVPAADMTIAEAQAAAADANVSIAGTVYAACKSGAVIGDATGFIFYYNNDCDLAVGDIVKMTGKVSAYGGFNQLTNTAEVEKVATGTKVTYPAVVKLDGAGLDAWYADPKIQYIQVTGELVISGNYYNLNVEGTETTVGSLVKPLDSVLGDVTNKSKVTITGFAMYTSGGKYVNIIPTELVIGEKAETTDITNTPETAYTVSKCIELIDAGKGLENKVYIKGIVSAPYKDIFVDLSYGNATFFISEDGKADSPQFEIYRGYDFGGEKFTKEKIKLGDEVVFYGTMTKYKDTYETNQGAELILHNGQGSTGIGSVSVNNTNVIYDLTGRRVNRAENGIFIVNGKKVIR